MLGRWAVIFGGVAVTCVFAWSALSAQPTGRAAEAEAVSPPPGEFGVGDPGLIELDLPQLDGEAPEGEILDPDLTPDEAAVLPEVEYDIEKLPPPVRRLREQIIEAAVTGDIEKLIPIFEANDGPPAMSSDESGDPIEELRSLSGDPEGREILAILIEVLDAGYVHVDVGTPEEMYVWPYFARYPLDNLTGPQMVELFKLLTAGDYEDMKIYDVYLFYRVGISPNGVWRYFLAGD